MKEVQRLSVQRSHLLILCVCSLQAYKHCEFSLDPLENKKTECEVRYLSPVKGDPFCFDEGLSQTRRAQEMVQDYCHPKCGDGVRVPSEGCDDGNTKDGDGCSSSCIVETGYVCYGGNSSHVT